MHRHLATILLLLAMAVPALAQDEPQEVTVREINSISGSALDSLLRAEELGLSHAEIQALATPTLGGELVRFEAVLLTPVQNSGNASYNASTGRIGRVHVWVRDLAADTAGTAGMGIQLVDGNFETSGLLTTLPGEILEIDARVAVFTGAGGVAVQVEPVSVVPTGETIESRGISTDVVEPVVTTTSEINQSVGEGLQTVNWENYEDLNGQYVRLENVRVVRRTTGDRPNWDVTSDGGETVVNIYDISLRYRNDRGEYYPGFNNREEDFVPPPPGSVINIEGYLVVQGDDPFGTASPSPLQFSLVPWSDDDVEIVESPPLVTNLTGPDGIPGAEPVEVSVNVGVDPTRSIDDVTLYYYTSASADTVSLQPSSSAAETYTFSIPAAEDGVFVNYWVEATDNTGGMTASETLSYRVLTSGITNIAHIQQTNGDVYGSSPFAGITADMDIEAVVMSEPDASGFVTVQDGNDPWSGIFVHRASGLSQGDVIRITRGDISEYFDLSQLSNIEFEVIGSQDAYAPAVLTTDMLQDGDIAEAYEGMLLRFEDVTITSTNADAPSGPYGEFTFSNAGTTMEELDANALRADDDSDAISFELAGSFEVGQELEFIQGVLTYSFSNFKILPRTQADFPESIRVDVADEDEVLPEALTLSQNYPNPFNPVTTIEYRMPATGDVRLSVFDLLGREVAVLVDGTKTVGTHTATFDAANLASGLYLYRIEAGGQTIVRSMTLLK